MPNCEILRLASLAAAVLCLAAPAGVARAAEVFSLASPAFADNGVLDKRFAGKDATNPNCRGDNVSPPLQWSNAPAATKSFALLMYDEQGRNGLGVSHQVAYGIPAASTGFAQGALETEAGFVGGKGLVGKTVYIGPCPPPGSDPHHYSFVVIATDLDPGALEPGLTREQLIGKLTGHALAAAGVVARFGQ